MNNEENDDIKNNGLLLISEIKGKVFLPYTKEEVEELVKSEENEFSTNKEVVENFFIKPFEYYKNQYISRFKETLSLIVKREKMSIKDGIDLGIEMCKKRYLHPAIISACKNIDELNVYIDCFDKNELDEFKIFDIKYEIYPKVIKSKKELI